MYIYVLINSLSVEIFVYMQSNVGKKSRVINGLSPSNTYFVKVGFALIDILYVSLNGEKKLFCKPTIKYLIIFMSEYFFFTCFECLMTFWIDRWRSPVTTEEKEKNVALDFYKNLYGEEHYIKK